MIAPRVVIARFIECLRVCVLSHFSPFLLFDTMDIFATLWTVTHQASLSMGLSRQECWSGLLSPSPGDLHSPGTEPTSTASPELQADSLPSAPPEWTHSHSFFFPLKICFFLKLMVEVNGTEVLDHDNCSQIYLRIWFKAG